MTMLGFVNIFNIAFFVVYSWFTYDYFGYEAYWMNMLVYESCMLAIHVIFLLRVVDQRIWNFEIPVLSRFTWYARECVKTISVTPLELVLTYGFYSYNADKTELAAFSIFMIMMDNSYSFCLAIVNYPKAKLNETIGKKDYVKAKKEAFYYLLVVTAITFAASTIYYLVLTVITMYMPDSSPYKPYFERCNFAVAAVFFVITIFAYLGFVGFSIELKLTVLGLRIFIGIFMWSVFMYFFIIRWELKILGMILADILDQVIRIVLISISIYRKDWNQVEGASRKK